LSTAAIDRQGSARLQAVLDFFSSIKLTVCLLIGLAATSIIGTLIPQKEDPEAYIEAFGQAKYELFKALQFTDLYHSWWFIGLLTVLMCNLLVCSLRRLPTTLRAMAPPNYRIDEGFFAKQHQQASFQTRLAPAEVGTRAAPLIRIWFSAKGAPLWLLALIAGLVGVFAGLIISSEQWVVLTSVGVCEAVVVGAEMVRRARAPLPQARAATNPEEGEDGVVVYAEKGRASRLGVYVVHASIILIMAGAIIGLLYGVRGAVRIGEGDTVNYFWVRHPKHKEALPFGVRVDDFSVSFYETGQPKEFKSVVSIIEDGKVAQTTPVLVNSPLSYGGYRLYQSDYGPIGLTGLKLRVQPREGGEASVLEVPGFNRPIPLPDGTTFSVVDSQENLVGLGPAFRLHVDKAGGEHADFWIFERLPDFDRDRGGDLVFGVAQADMRYYSGLEVSRDPGVWIVWAGCTLMVLGFLVAFFMSHRRLWLRAVPKAGGKTLVQVGGRTNKNRPGFETEFAALCDALKGELR
jgi:cytochrome c biogenesis protein